MVSSRLAGADHKVILCLSSGANPQYRLDILRLLALPSGTDIQFRYGAELIAEQLRPALTQNKLLGSPVLLAYVDTTPEGCIPGQYCPVTPCRYGALQQSTQVGDFYTLRFRLQEFAPTADSASFQSMLPADRAQMKTDCSPKGLWCMEVGSPEVACPRSDKPEAWQRIIRELWVRKDFRDEPFFFTVTDIYARSAKSPVVPSDGEYRFRSGENYEMSLLHWHPTGDSFLFERDGPDAITVNFGSEYLEPVTSPKLPVYSPYDLKPFHFGTKDTVRKQSTAIVIRVEDRLGQLVQAQPELYLPVWIEPSWVKAISTAGFIAVALWIEQWIGAAAKGPIGGWTVLGLLGMSVVTAAAVVFGWKKV